MDDMKIPCYTATLIDQDSWATGYVIPLPKSQMYMWVTPCTSNNSVGAGIYRIRPETLVQISPDTQEDFTLQKLQALHASVEDAIKQLRQAMAQIEDETLQLRRERAMNANH